MMPLARTYCTYVVIGAAALAPAAVPRYVASREIVLEYTAANAAEVADAQLWVSTDAGRTWQAAEIAQVGERTLRYLAPGDGKYDFYLVLRNAAGASAPAPAPGCTPSATILVDTVPPLFQIHAADTESDDEGHPTVAMKVTLVEENLSDTGFRVFYRTTAESWVDGGPARLTDGRMLWSPPESAGPRVDLRTVVTDLAGNRTASDAHNVTIRQPTSAPTSEPAASQPTAPPGPVVPFGPVEPPHVADVAPVAVAPVRPSQTLAAPEHALSPPTPDPADLQRLRSLAAKAMEERHYPLAANRFQDALALAPQDPELLVGLGSALYREGRYDEARTRFQSAADTLPDHVPAIEGLALVAATQKRYPQARAHLQQLQRLLPDSASVWLRSGDIEHKLGNTADALAAWERALRLGGADDELRAGAKRRLDYFGPEGKAGDPPATTSEAWPERQPRPQLSSCSETKSTKKAPR